MEGVILSTWDHIMGPQIEKLWLVCENSVEKVSEVPVKDLRDFNVSKRLNDTKSLDASLMKTYAAMCGQLLLGEVDTCRTVGEWPSRIYVSENKVLLAIMFHLNSWSRPSSNKSLKDVCLCLGTLFKYNEYDFILYSHLSIDCQLRKIVSAFINSKFSDASCLKNAIALVKDITELETSIQKLCLADMIIKIPFKLWFSRLVPDLSFCIESHLQTSGNSLVIGDSFLINEVIYLLLKFTCPTKPNSSSKKSYGPKSSIMGIHIPFSNKYRLLSQDLDKNNKFLLKRKNKELGPLTVIDLHMKKVWRVNFEVNFKTGKREDSLYPVNETGHLVPELLSNVQFIENNKGNSRKHIEDFKLGLITKSCALIKSIDHSRTLYKFRNFVAEHLILFCSRDLCAEKFKRQKKSELHIGSRVRFS